MNMKERYRKRKWLAMLCIVCIVFCLPFASCQAATASWVLRYVKGGPASVQVEEWSKTVETTQETTIISATRISDGAVITVYTDNGIFGHFNTPSATTVETKKGVKVYAYVKFYKHGNASNRPLGRLTY